MEGERLYAPDGTWMYAEIRTHVVKVIGGGAEFDVGRGGKSC